MIWAWAGFPATRQVDLRIACRRSRSLQFSHPGSLHHASIVSSRTRSHSIMKYLCAVLASAVLAVSSVRAQSSEEILTNDSVITMVSMKLADEIVLAKILAAKNDFDTSTAALAQLQEHTSAAS